MIKKITALLIIISFFQFSLPQATIAEDTELKTLPVQKSDSEKNDFVEGEVIVTYKSEKKQKAALKKFHSLSEEASDSPIEIKDSFEKLNMAVLKSDKKSTKELMAEIKKDTTVEFVEPNYKRELTFIPNDSYFSSLWAHRNTGQTLNSTSGTADADVDTAEMWDIESVGVGNTIIAVLDDGVEHTNTDLDGNMWDGSSNCKSDTGASISCPYHGWDYENNDSNPNPQYDYVLSLLTNFSHGTFVSSILGAEVNNSSGISGVSRYGHNKIMAVRFGLDVASEIKAINFAKNNGAKVINASFVGSAYSQSEKNAIDAFPGIFVTAAGNSSKDIGATAYYPCAYTSSNIICVASSTQKDQLSSFSNYNATSVDIAAPGENIVGIANGSTYVFAYGTSFATPLVAGAVGALWSQNPGASIATIRNTLLQSSDHKSSLSGKTTCGRRMNVNTALVNIKSSTIPIESCLDPIYKSYSQTTSGDWNNNGIGKIGLYNNGLWYLDINNNGIWEGTSIDRSYYFGYAGTTPVAGDWDNDGSTEIGVYDGKGTWYLDMNNNGIWEGTSVDKSYYFGYAGTSPAVGDWDNDGSTEIGVYDGNGRWYLDMNNNGTWEGATTDRTYWFGYAGTTPAVGDWDNDGFTEIGVYDGNGRWYLDMNNNGTWEGATTDRTYWFGYAGTTPAVGDWDNDGFTEIGVYKADEWYLDKDGNGSWNGASIDINITNF